MTSEVLVLGSLHLLLRGFDHESPLEAHVDIKVGDKLRIQREPSNFHDKFAILVTDSDDQFVGRVARENSESCHAMLLALRTQDISVELTLLQFKCTRGWKTTEVLSRIDFIIDDSTKFDTSFSSLINIMSKLKDLAFCPTRRKTIKIPSPSLCPNALLIHQKLLKQIGREEIIKSGPEESIFSGVLWRLVGASLVFDATGKVVIHEGEVVFRLFYHQVGLHPSKADWTRILKRTESKCLKTRWIDKGKVFKTINSLRDYISNVELNV